MSFLWKLRILDVECTAWAIILVLILSLSKVKVVADEIDNKLQPTIHVTEIYQNNIYFETKDNRHLNTISFLLKIGAYPNDKIIYFDSRVTIPVIVVWKMLGICIELALNRKINSWIWLAIWRKIFSHKCFPDHVFLIDKIIYQMNVVRGRRIAF